MTRYRAAAACAICALWLAGCALQAPPAHEEIVRDALPPKTAVPPAWKAPSDAALVAGDWLKALNDPALDALVAEALLYNRDLAQAAERVRIAQQQVIVAGAQLLPQVGIALGGRTSRDEDHDGSFNSSVAYAGVAWEIDLWGRLRAQRAAVEATSLASEQDFAFARLSLAATVARAWIVAGEARQLLGLAEQSVRIYGGLLKLVTLRREAGKDSDLNLAEMRAKLDAAQSQVEAARQAYAEAQRALEVLLGRYPAAELEAPTAYFALPPPPGAGAPAALLERRPDIAAADLQVLAAFRNEEAAQAALYPGVSISLLGGRLGDALLSTLQLNPWLATAAIGVSIPIYEGGVLRAQVQIANAQQAQAVARYGAVALAAFREVENALGNERLLGARLPFGEGAAAAAADAVRIAELQYRAGSRDLLWVSNLQSQQIAAEAALIQLRGQQRINRIGLVLALGGGFDDPSAVAVAR